MRRILQKTTLILAFLAAAGAFPVAQETLMACPNCKNANETDDRKPKAYMYSILFMLAMPATVFSGFAFSFYRLSKKQQAMQAAELAGMMPEDGVGNG